MVRRKETCNGVIYTKMFGFPNIRCVIGTLDRQNAILSLVGGDTAGWSISMSATRGRWPILQYAEIVVRFNDQVHVEYIPDDPKHQFGAIRVHSEIVNDFGLGPLELRYLRIMYAGCIVYSWPYHAGTLLPGNNCKIECTFGLTATERALINMFFKSDEHNR
jgi:hypothetical protein